ncbi:MAG: DUF2141 domain-containing protein [Rubricoccaceae bacterium]
MTMSVLLHASVFLALILGGPPSPSLLQIEVEGLRSNNGSVRIAIFDSEDTFLGDAHTASIRPIVGRKSVWAVALPPGDYAIAVHHDEDGDGEMATGLFGLPSEPVGFSQGARITFGPPKWRRAAFALPAEGATVTIRVR